MSSYRIVHKFLNKCSGQAHCFTSHQKKAYSGDCKGTRIFSQSSAKWQDENGPFKALHSLNILRVPWILQNTKKNDSLVDVGCGGGILSVPLARAGLYVTGIDTTEELIAGRFHKLSKRFEPYWEDKVSSARDVLESRALMATDVTRRITFHCTSVENFSTKHQQEYDAVVASEVIEHVEDLNSFVSGCTHIAKSGAPIFITTINKTVLSRIFAIWLAEDVMAFVPQGAHQWDKFVDPSQLSAILVKNSCTVRAINGFTFNPIRNVWYWTPNIFVNYACLAVKN